MKSLSLRALAAESGVSHIYISEIERGVKPAPSDEVLDRLAEALGEDIGKLRATASTSRPVTLNIAHADEAVAQFVYALARKVEENGLSDEMTAKLESLLKELGA